MVRRAPRNVFEKHGRQIARQDKRIPQPVLAMIYGPPAPARTFPVGARVYVDGRDEAIIAQVFPEGSTSLLSAHYCVRFVGGGPEQVKVAMSRVGVERREHGDARGGDDR